MLWGILIIGSLAVVVTIMLIVRTKSADKRAAEDRRRRFAIKDTGERVPLAPAKAIVEPIAIPDDGTPIFAPSKPEPAAAPRTSSIDDLITITPAIAGRLVHTPDGEMILTSPPFQLREAIFSTKSGRFVNMISRRAPAWILACPRVRLDSLLTPTKPDGRDPADWREWRRRVRVRSIDLVLCDRRSWKPLVAVLFDQNRSIDARKVAGGQDRIIDEVLAVVGLPLLRLTGDFEKDWPLIKPYVEESILPNMTDEQVMDASMRPARVDGDAAVTLLRMDQEKGWILE